MGQVTEYPSQPALIAQGLSQAFRLAKVVEKPPELSEGVERIAQVEAEIDGLFDGLAALREMLQRTERLLEPRHRLPVGRPVEGLGARLTEVLDGFLPDLAPEGVVAQPLDVFGQPPGMQGFDGLHDPAVEDPAPLLQEAPVRHLVREGMLERVFEIGEQARLVEELGGLQVCKAPAERLLRE